MTVKGKVKNYDEMFKKATESEDAKKAKSENPEAGEMMEKSWAAPSVSSRPTRKTSSRCPLSADRRPPPGGEDNPLEKLDDLGEDERAMIEQQMEQMRAMFALDQMKIECASASPAKSSTCRA
jgi:hypothetical protein